MKILVIRFSSLGDIVLVSPVTRALRKHYPDSLISVAVKREYETLAHALPGVDNVLALKENQPAGDFARSVRHGGYDIVVDLHRNPRSLLVSRLGKAGRVVSYRKRRLARMAMLHRCGRKITPKHTIENYLASLKGLGITDQPENTELMLDGNVQEAVADRLRNSGVSEGQAVIGIAPGASSLVKAWPSRYFAAVADSVHRRYGARILLFGSREDQAAAGEVSSAMEYDALNWAGDLELSMLPAAISTCRLLICNDSGPMHVATAVKTPVIGLFGPTHPRLGFAPRGKRDVALTLDLSCSPCSLHGNRPCWKDHRQCLTDLSADLVLNSVSQIMGA